MHDSTLRVTRATRAATANGRRSALIGASAAVVCLGGVLAGCGSGGGHGGYAAVGAPGASGEAGGGNGPTAGVTFVPLDGGGPAGGGDGRGGGSPSGTGPADGGRTGTGTTPVASTAGAGSAAPGGPAEPGTRVTAPPSAPGAPHGRTTAPAPASTPPAASTEPPAPAALTWSGPELADGAHRWCDEVTVAFRNSGGSPVRSGTVTFGTHVVDALGIDWATLPSTQDLPVPIAAGARTSKTWTVCVESWRVPLGMHVETRDVSVRWD